MTDKKYSKNMIISIAVPMMIQNGLTNLVTLLDNLMIGGVGTNALSGVSVSNQLNFVFMLMIFGATAGVGIFTAQYHGKGDIEGVRNTFRFKLVMNTCISLIALVVLYLFAPDLIGLFLLGEGDPADAAEILSIGTRYINIMLLGLLPLGITFAYSGTLRDTGNTKVPMIASAAAIVQNLIGNALLIYGLMGLPKLGPDGAAISTVLSRITELLILVIYTGTHKKKAPFIEGAFRNFRIPGKLALHFLIRSLPLVANETLWSMGTTFINECYSYRSLNAVSALNIENTLYTLLGVPFIAFGEAVGIVVGHILGNNDIEGAKKYAKKMQWITTLFGVIFGLIMACLAPVFPSTFVNVSESVRLMACEFIFIFGIFMPFYAYTHVSYFIIRAGGNVFITFLFDSLFMVLVTCPAAFILSRYTGIPVTPMIAVVQSLEIIKCIIGGVMVNKGIWAKNIVSDTTL